MEMDPALTVVAKIAPRAMNAPARIAKTNIFQNGMDAFLIPMASAFAAISPGIKASILTALLFCSEDLLKTSLGFGMGDVFLYRNFNFAYACWTHVQAYVCFNFSAEVFQNITDGSTGSLTKPAIGDFIHTVRQVDQGLQVFQFCNSIGSMDSMIAYDVGVRIGKDTLSAAFVRRY
jgi:hypothetical protein